MAAETPDVKPCVAALLPHPGQPRWVEEPRDQARTDFFEEIAEHCDLTMAAAVWRYTRAAEPRFTLNHPMRPDPAMESAFPLRDPTDPMRVHPRYADASGRVDRRVVVLDVQPPSGPLKYLMGLSGVPGAQRRGLCEQLAEDVRAELERLVRGRRESPRYEVRQLRAGDLREHESVLIGQYGLFGWPDEPEAQRPVLENGRVVGLFVGALLETPDEEAAYARSHPGYNSYAVSFRRGDGRMVGQTGLGAANGLSFANTALLPGTPARYDHARLNAHLIPFHVRLTNAQGKPSRATVVALVAMASAYGPGNPTREFRVDYGPHFLSEFDQRWASAAEMPIEIKQEMEVDPPPGEPRDTPGGAAVDDEPFHDEYACEQPATLCWATQETALVMEDRVRALAPRPLTRAALMEEVPVLIATPLSVRTREQAWGRIAGIDPSSPDSGFPLQDWHRALLERESPPDHPSAEDRMGHARRLALAAYDSRGALEAEDLMLMAQVSRRTADLLRRLPLQQSLATLMREHPQYPFEPTVLYGERLRSLGASETDVRLFLYLPDNNAQSRAPRARQGRVDGAAKSRESSTRRGAPRGSAGEAAGAPTPAFTPSEPLEPWQEALLKAVPPRVVEGEAPTGHALRLVVAGHLWPDIIRVEDLMKLSGVGLSSAKRIRRLRHYPVLAALIRQHEQHAGESERIYAMRLAALGAPIGPLRVVFLLPAMGARAPHPGGTRATHRFSLSSASSSALLEAVPRRAHLEETRGSHARRLALATHLWPGPVTAEGLQQLSGVGRRWADGIRRLPQFPAVANLMRQNPQDDGEWDRSYARRLRGLGATDESLRCIFGVFSLTAPYRAPTPMQPLVTAQSPGGDPSAPPGGTLAPASATDAASLLVPAIGEGYSALVSAPPLNSLVLQLILHVSNAAARGEHFGLSEALGVSTLSRRTVHQTLFFCRHPAVRAALPRLPPRERDSQLRFLQRLLAAGGVPEAALKRYPGYRSLKAAASTP